MRCISPLAIKHSIEALQSGSYAVITITALLRRDAVESADTEEGLPFLDEFTEGGLLAALDVIGAAMSREAEWLVDVIEEASESGLILQSGPSPQPAECNTGGGA
jgi:hypothetical protein